MRVVDEIGELFLAYALQSADCAVLWKYREAEGNARDLADRQRSNDENPSIEDVSTGGDHGKR